MDIRGLAERTESYHYNYIPEHYNESLAFTIPRSVDVKKHATNRFPIAVYEKRTQRKKKKFFFCRHSAGRTPTVFAKKRRHEHSIPPGPNFTQNSRHEK
jgi:hypothetical protein